MAETTNEGKDGGGWSIRHFYLAVGGSEFKLSTLKELLEAFGERQQRVALAICCRCVPSTLCVVATSYEHSTSRDELDKAVRAIEEKLETSAREDDERVTSGSTAESLHTVSCL
eukprot:919713-Pyramimonas_sp.AAC.1